MIDRYPRETVDFIPFADLTINGALVSTVDGLEVAVVQEHSRPQAGDWGPAQSLAPEAGWVPPADWNLPEGWADGPLVGFILDGPTLGRGVFRVFVRKPDAPTTPVIEAGYFRLT